MNIKTEKIKEFESREKAMLAGYGVPLTIEEAQNFMALPSRDRAEALGRTRQIEIPAARQPTTKHRFKARALVSR